MTFENFAQRIEKCWCKKEDICRYAEKIDTGLRYIFMFTYIMSIYAEISYETISFRTIYAVHNICFFFVVIFLNLKK